MSTSTQVRAQKANKETNETQTKKYDYTDSLQRLKQSTLALQTPCYYGQPDNTNSS